MALTLKQWTDYAVAKLTDSIEIGYDLGDMLDLAGMMLKSGNIPQAGGFLCSAADYMYDYCKAAATRYTVGKYRLTGALYFINDNFPEPVEEYELTWKKICEAWVKDDFEGKEWTIACIDRMRALMWDKPFFIKWAASPTEKRE